VLLDSAAVAGFLDRSDAFHVAAAVRVRELAGRERLIASIISYAELLTGAGLGHHDHTAVRGFFADLIDEVHDVDLSVAERAAELRTAKPSLRMPDALILATADVHNADVIVTADHSWDAVLPGTRVELLHAGEQ
jgi:predicted nucleic acid-binding protein